ncbi:dihydroorotase [Segetibacter sp. 3557_3]|uniref:dihydroorotase n=1 Tax=Segetibacter sp. 3557_3 TaxID=2547429 RepID=UPI001FB827A8|nr:dihydroorotase [Segetibacter sp. 3557_3]
MNYLLKDIWIVNENRTIAGDVFIKEGRIEKIGQGIQVKEKVLEINGKEQFLLPGVIDDQVHFREPGLTHKASIYTESKAAVAGGVTSFMEMPNTVPPVFTQELLEEKYSIASKSSLANYSFYMGTGNDNIGEVLKTNDKKNSVCGVKVFMGSSTGNLLVDNPESLERVFAGVDLLIATHCEEEAIIKRNYETLKTRKGLLDPADHLIIRDEEACYQSSLKAVQLAKKHNTRLHILHISTEKELDLFTTLPLNEKRITAEVCVHHLHFTGDDYSVLGNRIKCNPAIKAPHHRSALWTALLDGRLDVIATDHAPHTLQEKGYLRNADGGLDLVPETLYEHSHAGLPLVQHTLLMMLNYVQEGRISIGQVVSKMSHAVAECFGIKDRGYIREGYYADLVMVDPNAKQVITPENILYKCGWSPLEQTTMSARITHTFVNGNLVYGNGQWDESQKGERLQFSR